MTKLSEEQEDYIRYFVRSYQKNFKQGRLEFARHDAAAITLFLISVLGEEQEEEDDFPEE